MTLRPQSRNTAGHRWRQRILPELLITPDRRAEYLYAEPGLPLNVDSGQPRPDHTRPLPLAATVVFFTDGLVENPDHPIDQSLNELAELATTHAALPLQDFVRALADHHSSDGHDDMAILALRTPS
ncbi:PP2C family protein-serine/threonine phosphatase [Streptomyces tailanensis]|uniref:PP2C family protein-serine/threonine phosphatase n=1 Tax=Streptomyces tailanensis TaxID=2569858 RepID=UPI003CCC498C